MNLEHAFNADDNYYEEVLPDVWLMDDHRWAYLIWEISREKFDGRTASIIHIDYHWDAGDDFFEYPKMERKFKSLSLNDIKPLVKDDRWIRFDSFICPAIIRGIINEVHFLCYQDDGDVGIHEGSLEKHQAQQFIYRSSKDLKKQKFNKPYIFDFCIDVFNRSDMYYEGDIWNIEEVDNFLDDLELLVKNAKIVTVSMSYGYSGTTEDTKRLTNHVMGKFCDWRT